MGRTKQAPEGISRKQVASGRKLSDVAAPVAKRKHRFRPGTVALRHIKKYQKSTARMIPRAAFVRVVREIAQDLKANAGMFGGSPHDVRFKVTAFDALQEAAEDYMSEFFTDMQHHSIFRGAKTIAPKDLKHTRFMRDKEPKHRPDTLIDFSSLPTRTAAAAVKAAIADDDGDDDEEEEEEDDAEEEGDDE